MARIKTYVHSIGMGKKQYYFLKEQAQKEGMSVSKMLYKKLDLENVPEPESMPEGE